MRKNTSGFTIVELLIVIVVIAILASITVVAYNGVKERADATAITAGLKQIEKSLRLYSIEKGWSVWPKDGDLPGVGDNPSIPELISSLDGFSSYLAQAPSTPQLPASAWSYDSDGDSKTTCDGKNSGTNIVISGVSESIANAIDNQIDDGDRDCNQIRWRSSDSKLFYVLSFSDTL